MPSPEEIKAIIDGGAYAAGTVICVNGTLPWKLSQGIQPSNAATRKYIKAAKNLEEAGEELVAEITSAPARPPTSPVGPGGL